MLFNETTSMRNWASMVTIHIFLCCPYKLRRAFKYSLLHRSWSEMSLGTRNNASFKISFSCAYEHPNGIVASVSYILCAPSFSFRKHFLYSPYGKFTRLHLHVALQICTFAVPLVSLCCVNYVLTSNTPLELGLSPSPVTCVPIGFP